MPRQYTLVDSPSGHGIDYAADLNPQQYEAVTSPPGPALVLAGAGSGKTHTLTYRVAYLLESGIDPRNILLLTFTNKAAREMIERVKNLAPGDTKALWSGTFHSIGNRILRRHADTLGYDRSFTIMDREDQKDLIASTIVESNVDTKAMKFPKPQLLGDIFSLAVNTGEDVERIILRQYPYFSRLLEPIVAIQKLYEKKKQDTNNMDFDDLLVKTVQLLEKEEDVLLHYQRMFQYVLVDEYQDTNLIQSRFIDLLAREHRNLMVVGDDAQSIYSWRGANFRNIIQFPERYPGAKVYKIETNYRSVPEILTLANSAIAANTGQFEKSLQPSRSSAEARPALVRVRNPDDQAQFVAQRILELRDENGMDLNEIAVLYRAHFHCMELELELQRRGIPFRITSGLRFFERAHIKDVTAFMKLATNHREEVAFHRIVRMLPGIGNKTAGNLWRAWLDGPGQDKELTRFSPWMLDQKIPARGQKAWEQLAYTMDELIVEGEPAPPPSMITSILGGVYEDYLKAKFTDYEQRIQDIDQLSVYSARFDDMPDFLSQLSLLTGVDTGGTPAQEKDPEAVTLSSVHQAKGLEWNAVFILWLTEGMFPNARVISGDDSGEGLEEERRLFYVAVTRAKDDLYLLHPMMWPGSRTGEVMQRPSRFLRDFPSDLVEEWQVGHGPF